MKGDHATYSFMVIWIYLCGSWIHDVHAFASESLTSNYTRSLGVMVVNLIHQIHLNGRALEVYNWNMQMSQVTDS